MCLLVRTDHVSHTQADETLTIKQKLDLIRQDNALLPDAVRYRDYYDTEGHLPTQQ